MQDAPKQQMNAEEMLAELKRALESSTRAPDAPPPSASTAPKPRSPGLETGRSQIDNRSDLPVKATADKSIGPRAGLQKSTRPSSRSWKLIGGGLALAAAAAIFVSFAFMSKPSNLPERELSIAAGESPARPQNEQTLEPSSSPRAPMQDSQQAEPLQAGNLETGPDARTAPLIGGSLPAGGKAEVDAPNLASSGLESAAPALTPLPLNQPATPVATHRIGPDGAPITTAPSSPASTDAAHPAGTPKPAAQTAVPQMVKPDKASLATAPSAPVSTNSAPPLADAPKPAAPIAAPPMVKSNRASVATAPPTQASTDSAPPLADAPKPAAPIAAPPMVKSNRVSVATALPTQASTDSAPPLAQTPMAQTPKPNATQTVSVPNESAEPSKPKSESKKKPPEKISQQKPAKSAKASATPIPAEPQPTKLAPPKEAESPPHPAQDAGNPTALAPATKTSVQQRVADGVTHAFGYLMHLPGALVPHLGGPNPDAH
jgi:hypothetical protein